MFKSDYGILEIDSAVPIGEILNKLCQEWSGYPDFGGQISSELEHTLQFLNQGHFHKLLMLLANAGKHELRYDKAVIEKEDLMIIRSALQHIEIHAEAEKQMEKALNEYKSNGEGWHFESSSIGSESNPGRSVPIEEMEDEDKFGELGIWRRESSQLSARLRSYTELIQNVLAQVQKDSEQTKRGSEDQKDVD